MSRLVEEMMKQAAIKYAKAGFPVFPCCFPDPTNDYKCGCGRNHDIKNVGKVPLTPNGLTDATTNIKQIEEWWAKYPQANIGIAVPDKYFVLDVDINHEGYESLGKLQELIGILPETLTITTGTGGSHIWYETHTPIKNTTNLHGFRGLDIRGRGGYVITSPSLHQCGERYVKSKCWNGKIQPAPEELIKLCLIKYQPVYQPTMSTDSMILIEGQRNDRLASLAGTLRAKGLSQSAIEASLMAINNEQCNPPLPEREVRTIAASYSRYPAGSRKDVDWMKTSGKF